MILKNLLKLLDGTTSIVILENNECWGCDFAGEEWDCQWCRYYTGARDEYGLPEEECEHRTIEIHCSTLFDGHAEDVPFNLIDRNIENISLRFVGAGKDGRKKRSAKAIMEVRVKS